MGELQTRRAEKPPHPDLMTRERALKLATDAIDHDERRTPYGHHQHGRDYAKQWLRALMAGPETDERRLVAAYVCTLCLDGVGDECHVPGCAFWMQAPPSKDLSVVLVPWWKQAAFGTDAVSQPCSHPVGLRGGDGRCEGCMDFVGDGA